ncbi:MAG TPA: DUF5777 family beta-barrel protein [Chitinophagaceae bacterium]|nr:DUF5777 family beta-barrel protein [Chitinophagaceae bacterium]
MKNCNKKSLLFLAQLFFLTSISNQLCAQDSTEVAVATKARPVKNTFESVLLMDNQTVMVPVKGTFEWDIQHRFGTVKKGSKDLWGVFAPSNIRLGFNYSPVKDLYVGAGITKEKMQIDVNAKYAIFRQTPGKVPVSITVFGNTAYDPRGDADYKNTVDRFSYFSELIIARKVTDKFSAQVAPNFSWFNNVEAYVDSKGIVQSKMHNGHFAISFAGRYKVSEKSAVIAGYNQPLTDHPTNNPHPNICFGFETTSSSHAFQVFFGNYYSILPEYSNVLNQNDYTNGQFLLGFNITKLWNF